MLTLRLLLLSATALAVPSIGDGYYRINFGRFHMDGCPKHNEIDHITKPQKLPVISSGEGCHTFPDHIPFSSASYDWARHNYWKEKQENYGSCWFNLYEEVNCQGRNMGQAAQINTEKHNGDCIGGFHGPDGKPGKAKSIHMQCEKD